MHSLFKEGEGVGVVMVGGGLKDTRIILASPVLAVLESLFICGLIRSTWFS